MKLRRSYRVALTHTDLRSLGRWFGLCAFVGVAAGLAGAAFVSAIDGVQTFMLGKLLGVWLDQPAHVADSPGTSFISLWFLPLIPAVGGLCSGIIARAFGTEVFGGGTDAVLRAYHQRDAKVSWHVPIGKWLASIVTLGTGGSAGREGPMTLVGGGIGSVIGSTFRVTDRERRLLLLAGAGAGVGAVFRIPFGSAIFAIEVLYRDGFEEEGIFPCLIASVFGFAAFVAIHGSGHMFGIPPLSDLVLSTVPLFALVGLAVAPFGYLFTKMLALAPRVLGRVVARRWLRPCLGGLLVGLLGLLHPELMGIGYGWIRQVLAPSAAAPASVGLAGLFVLFALGKILATGLTVGSGGSGGTFAPSIVTGAFVGGAVGQVLSALFPALVPEPGAFALVGMGAFLGGVAHVPLAAVVIVCELVGNYDLLVPLMVAVGVSYLLLRHTTLYEAQVQNASASPARARGIALDALGTLRVHDLGELRPAPTPIPATMRLSAFITQVVEGRATIFPIQNDAGPIREVVTVKSLRAILDNSSLWPHLIVADAATPLLPVRTSDSLHRLLEVLGTMDCDEVFIVDAAGFVIGVAGYEDVVRLTVQESIRRKAEADVTKRFRE